VGCAIEELVAVMARLRGPDGCPWDRKQTLDSLRSFLLEETHEVMEAIEMGRPEDLREELGDLLLQVVFLSQICTEQGQFGIQEVALGIAEKLVRRHPHVFSSERADSAAEAIARWETIKNIEKSAKPGASVLDGVPRQLPALQRAHRLGTKASIVGFDWAHPEQIQDKLDEERAEFREAAAQGNPARMAEEMGDLLFVAANLARAHGIDPELALQDANRKFISRFGYVEREMRRRGAPLEKQSQAMMEDLWEEAKRREGGEG
jgi:tetrapyrrole methylase family protein/MazG family protein